MEEVKEITVIHNGIYDKGIMKEFYSNDIKAHIKVDKNNFKHVYTQGFLRFVVIVKDGVEIIFDANKIDGIIIH